MNFESQESFVLINPRLKKVPPLVASLKSLYPSHFWLLTSGTTGGVKGVALSKEALLSSAEAVNSWIDCKRGDIWVNPLPIFHVGGLSIYARSFLTGGKVYPLEKWDPESFLKLVEEKNASFTSLVPTQMVDLIDKGLKAPKNLKGVFIGGGFFPDHLFEKGIKLAWPLYLTYGMTECASQVATSFLNQKTLYPLPHLSLKSVDERLWIKGKSLLTSYAFFEKERIVLSDPKKEGWFPTEDAGLLEEGKLKVMGRSSDYIKICGEGIYLSSLEELLQEVCQTSKMTLVPIPDERRGEKIAFVYERAESLNVKWIVDQFNKRVLPVAKIHEVFEVESFPRTPLGKIMREDLKKMVLNQRFSSEEDGGNAS